MMRKNLSLNISLGIENFVKKEMETGVWKLKVPLKVDIAIGKNWREC